MPVSVLFTPPVTPSQLSEIQAALEAIDVGADHWEVRISARDEAGGYALTIAGPGNYQRLFRIFGGEEGRFEPAYVAALVRTEIRFYPTGPPEDLALALGELTRLGVPYDDTELLRGKLRVGSVRVSVDRLIELYRDGILSPGPPDDE